MSKQIAAIAWAQFRIARNHLPRTTLGSILTGLLSCLWYSLFAAAAAFAAWKLPSVPLDLLNRWLPAGLLGLLLVWQAVPLFTLSSGWSLELKKLQAYPIPSRALFGIELLLRLTSAPEMVIVLAGVLIGLLRHGSLPFGWPLVLLAYIPVNLFLQLGIRDLVLHAFERNRFRELFAVVIISLGLLPQLLLRTAIGRSLAPYFLAFAHQSLAPWAETARIAMGRGRPLEFSLLLVWIALCYFFARSMFNRSLRTEETLQVTSKTAGAGPRGALRLNFFTWPAQVFGDPLAALMQKELRCLTRMPRFRVLFGMACLLGIVVFIPMTLNEESGAHFMRNNLIPVVNLYGLLLLSDALLLNAFGLDRGAAQTYFLVPIPLGVVIKAKNLSAIVFVVLQSVIILFVAALARASITPIGVASGLLASAVVTVFLLSVGNFTSVSMPRAIDPRQTFKKQAAAKMQLWLLTCSVGLLILVGFAYLARYALQSDWVLLAVLFFEFLVGLYVYHLGMQSAVARGVRDRELITAALSKSPSPVSIG